MGMFLPRLRDSAAEEIGLVLPSVKSWSHVETSGSKPTLVCARGKRPTTVGTLFGK